MIIKRGVITLGLIGLIAGCSSPKKREPRVHPAVISSQTYFIDNGMPVRELEDQPDFFFKKCNVDNRGAYPTKTTYDCNE